MIPERPKPVGIQNNNIIKTVVSSKDISINMFASNNIYDGDRAENNEHNWREKVHSLT